MTVDETAGSAAEPGFRRRPRLTAAAGDPARSTPSASFRCRAAASAEHRHHRQGLAGRLDGAGGLVHRGFLSDAVRRATDRVDAAVLRGIASPAHRLAHRRHGGGRPGRFRVVRDRRDGRRVLRRTDRVQALAAPVHVPRQPSSSSSSATSVLRLRAAAALRRHHDRPLGRLLVPGAAGRRRDLPRVGIIYSLVVAGRPRTIAKVVGAVVVAPLRRLASCTSRPTTRSTSSSGSRSPSRSRSTRSASSPRTRSFPVTYREGKTAHLDVGGRRGEALAAGGRGPARAHGARRQAGRASKARAARRRCGSASPAIPTRTCSGSSTR